MSQAQNSREAVLETLRNVQTSPSTIGVSRFRSGGTLAANTTGSQSNVAELQVGTPQAIRQGQPFYVGIPAYYTETLPSSDSSNQTIDLSGEGDLIQSPVTDDVVVYFDGERKPGNLVSTDYSNDEITVSHDNSGQELDVFFMAGDAATVEVYKEAPKSEGNLDERLFHGNLKILHNQDQGDQPPVYQLRQSEVQPVIPTDWKLIVYVDAPYDVNWSVSRSSGTAEPDNAVLGTPVKTAAHEIEGLSAVVRQDVASR